MNIEYDCEADGAFLWTVDDIDERNRHPKGAIKTEIWPKEMNEKFGILIGQDNKIIGFEILSASEFLPEKLLIDTYTKTDEQKT